MAQLIQAAKLGVLAALITILAVEILSMATAPAATARSSVLQSVLWSREEVQNATTAYAELPAAHHDAMFAHVYTEHHDATHIPSYTAAHYAQPHANANDIAVPVQPYIIAHHDDMHTFAYASNCMHASTGQSLTTCLSSFVASNVARFKSLASFAFELVAGTTLSLPSSMQLYSAAQHNDSSTAVPLLGRTAIHRRLIGMQPIARLNEFVTVALSCTFLSFVCFMAFRPPQALDPGNLGSLKIPPSWSPERERVYPFRHFQRDVMVWALATDLHPHQLAAAVVLRLGGVARDISRDLTAQQLAQGGNIQVPGQGIAQVDGLTFLMTQLQHRFGQLTEETNLISMVDLMSFKRLQGEPTDALLARFDSLRHRAAQANLLISVQGLCFILLNAVGISTEQRLQLLAPLQGRMPNDDAEFNAIVAYLRRMAHHVEHTNQPARTTLAYPTFSADPWTQGQDPWQHQPAQQQAYPAASGPDPWSNWQAPHASYPTASYQAYAPPPPSDYPEAEVDYTDTETSTDSNGPDSSAAYHALAPASKSEAIYWAYREAKRTWRRHIGKFPRRFRRAKGRKGGKGGKGGHGNSFGKSAFPVDMQFLQEVYLKGRSGKGGGKGRQNPRDKSGNIMTCSICGSEYHFRARCTQNSGGCSGCGGCGGKGFGSSSSSGQHKFFTTTGSPDASTWNSPLYGIAECVPCASSSFMLEDVTAASAAVQPPSSAAASEQPATPTAQHEQQPYRGPMFSTMPPPFAAQPAAFCEPMFSSQPTLSQTHSPGFGGALHYAHPDAVHSWQKEQAAISAALHAQLHAFSRPAPAPQPAQQCMPDPGYFQYARPAAPPQHAQQCIPAPISYGSTQIVSEFQALHLLRQRNASSRDRHHSTPSSSSNLPGSLRPPQLGTQLPQPTRYDMSEEADTQRPQPDHYDISEEADDEGAEEETPAFDQTYVDYEEPYVLNEEPFRHEDAEPEEEESYPWWQSAPDTDPANPAAAYHTNTQLPNEVGLVIDTAAIGNLQGSVFARRLASLAKESGFLSRETRRTQPLHVQGVGNGSQRCEFDGMIPIAVERDDGVVSLATYEAPIVPDSNIPGLWGLDSLIAKRAIIDCANQEIILCGPGGCKIEPSPGSERLKLKRAPSGHLLLPVSEFRRINAGSTSRHADLTLLAGIPSAGKSAASKGQHS